MQKTEEHSYYIVGQGLITMTNKTRSFSVFNFSINTTIAALLLGTLSPVIAAPADDQIRNAAQQLGLIQATPVTRNNITPPTRAVATTQRKVNPYEIKRQQQLRANLTRKKARLAKLQQLKIQRQNRYRAATQPLKHARNTNQQRGGNVWGRIYKGFRFPNSNYHPLVKKYINEFSRSPARLERLNDRASKYLYMVVNELNRRHMPTDLALLPFVESAYRNKAFSHAGAAGMWQFIPSTGRNFGLKQTGSYDARLDSFEATRAALDYLQKLNREFRGDWFLSLAAYNAGENRVHRAIAENKRKGLKTDYWNLRLPKETKQYVPRLLAFKEIFRNPRAYRVRLRGVPNTSALTQVRINKAVNLRQVAARAGLPSDTLTSLNPSYLHGITTPRYSNRIILPRQHAGRLNHAIHRAPAAADVHHQRARSYYASHRKSKRSKKYRGKSKKRYITHKVRRGDNLYQIARKHGTTVKKIKRLNKMRSSKIWPGKRLKVASRKRSSKRRSS